MSDLRERLKERWIEWSAIARLDYSLAFRNILRQKRRSFVGLSAITAGVIALLLAAGFFEWNYDGMREGTIRSQIGHIQVVRPGFRDAGAADPFQFLIPLDSPERKLIETFPLVEAVAPRLTFNGLISKGESTVSFLADGVDPIPEKKLNGYLTLLQGTNLESIKADEVIVGEGLAKTLGVKVGERVVLLANTKSRGVNAIEVTVKGIFATPTKAYDDYALRVPLETAQRLLKTSDVHAWLVVLSKTSKTDSLIEKMREKIPSKDLQFVPWHETDAADMYKKTVTLFSRQVLVVKLMIAIIIVLSIANTMMTNVRERTAEIGTCMALGDTQRTVLRRFIAEGVSMGLIGGLLGLVLGGVLAVVISAIGIPMPPPPGMTSGYIAGIMLTPGILIDAFLLAVVTTFFAGLYPAWKASRLQIVDALRHAR